MALSGTSGKILKVEFLNVLGQKKVFSVTLSSSQQNYTFDLTGFTALMAGINFVSDQLGTTAYSVETKGLTYIPVVPGATYNASLITTLPLSPVVASSHGTTTLTDNATISLTQTSTSAFSVSSLVPDTGDFTFSGASWGYFKDSNGDGIPDVPAVFIGTGATLGTSVTMALSGTAGKILKVEFLNVLGAKKVFSVTLKTFFWPSTFKNSTFKIFPAVPLSAIVTLVPRVAPVPIKTAGTSGIPSPLLS